MAGHSKWANIKHRKEKADAKKGKVFSRISKEIINAVKFQGPDPKSNHKLKIALQKAKEVNFPADNIERVIKKASSADQEAYHKMEYELYGHGGVGIIVDIMTDNKNRIASDIRIATNKRGGVIALPGSVQFNFDTKGIITLPKNEKLSEDQLFHICTEIDGVEDITTEEDLHIITTDPACLYAVKEALEIKNFNIDQAEISRIPKSYIDISTEIASANLALIEWLEEIDDVEHVYHNMHL